MYNNDKPPKWRDRRADEYKLPDTNDEIREIQESLSRALRPKPSPSDASDSSAPEDNADVEENNRPPESFLSKLWKGLTGARPN